MKIEVGINWPLASHVVNCMAGAATAVPASCYSGCLHPERPLAGCWLEVLKPFSQARLWGQKPWFPEDSPSNHLYISQWSKPFVCAQPPPFLCRTAHWFPWHLQTSGIDRWRRLADQCANGGPNCSLSNPDKALAMYKEIWTERRTLIFYLYKPIWECLIPLACPQPSSFLAIFPDHSLQGKNAKVPLLYS